MQRPFSSSAFATENDTLYSKARLITCVPQRLHVGPVDVTRKARVLNHLHAIHLLRKECQLRRCRRQQYDEVGMGGVSEQQLGSGSSE